MNSLPKQRHENPPLALFPLGVVLVALGCAGRFGGWRLGATSQHGVGAVGLILCACVAPEAMVAWLATRRPSQRLLPSLAVLATVLLTLSAFAMRGRHTMFAIALVVAGAVVVLWVACVVILNMSRALVPTSGVAFRTRLVATALLLTVAVSFGWEFAEALFPCLRHYPAHVGQVDWDQIGADLGGMLVAMALAYPFVPASVREGWTLAVQEVRRHLPGRVRRR